MRRRAWWLAGLGCWLMATVAFGAEAPAGADADKAAVADDDGGEWDWNVLHLPENGDGYPRGIFHWWFSDRASVDFRLPRLNHAAMDHALWAWATQFALAGLNEGGELLEHDPETTWSADGECLVLEAPGAVSVVIDTFWSYSGAAHPASTYHTLVFDRATGEALALEDVFDDEEKARAAFAREAPALVHAALRESLGDADYKALFHDGMTDDDPTLAWIRQGTAAEKADGKEGDNYDANWAPGADGMYIFFQEYQVVPRVMGRPVILVPLAALREAGPNPAIWPDVAH